ncbi:MAG: ribonuclease III [Eubacterium sp.]|nr:ribonuclease III [Eubacterium sp.]
MYSEIKNLSELEKRCGYRFHNVGLLRQALTHTSYANEHKLGHLGSNERLEFLGDAVLETVSSECLYKMYPDLPEGQLTTLRASLVCEPTLAFDAKAINLPDYLLLGKGEELTGGRERDSIVSDALESIIGAMYLDGGMKPAAKFIMTYIMNDIGSKQLFRDSKTKLQEIIQAESNEEVVYTLISETGPDHNKNFEVSVSHKGRILGTGSGRSKKSAEQRAAYQALLKLKKS